MSASQTEAFSRLQPPDNARVPNPINGTGLAISSGTTTAALGIESSPNFRTSNPTLTDIVTSSLSRPTSSSEKMGNQSSTPAEEHGKLSESTFQGPSPGPLVEPSKASDTHLSLGDSGHNPSGKRERVRRVMPARLRRVSNLLAGSVLEDELAGSASRMDGSVLPLDTTFFLTSNENIPTEPYHNPLLEEDSAFNFFSDPEMAKACRKQEVIETPDFKLRDESDLLGKTRSIRSEEDTSDAAYERRHRKPDNLEKRQRRLEIERLVRDRQKLKERIEQLKVADPRLLMPIIAAREHHQRENTNGAAIAEAPSPRESEMVMGAGKQNSSADVVTNLTKLEQLRTELLEEAHDTLHRYDALLPSEEVTLSRSEKRKRFQPDEGSGADDSDYGRATISARKSTGSLPSTSHASRRIEQSTPHASSSSLSKSASTSALSRRPSTPASGERSNLPHSRYLNGTPGSGKKIKKSASPDKNLKARQHFKPEDGQVRAETTYANIHARTSGGRFAPKSALKEGESAPPAGASTTTRKKAEKSKAPKRKQRTTYASTSRSVPARRRRSSGNTNDAGASTSEKKPRRVKLILSGRDRKDVSSSNDVSVKTEDAEVMSESEDLDLGAPPTSEPQAALTLEEAQRLLAMEEDEDDEDEDAEGEAHDM